jgi:hypothetical protein
LLTRSNDRSRKRRVCNGRHKLADFVGVGDEHLAGGVNGNAVHIRVAIGKRDSLQHFSVTLRTGCVNGNIAVRKAADELVT